MQLRKLFIAAMVLLSITGTAQEVVKDSVFLTKVGNDSTAVYYLTTTIEYDDGTATSTKVYVGDSTTTTNYLINRNIDRTRELAYHALKVVYKSQVIQDVNLDDSAAKAAGLGGTLDGIQKIFEESLIDSVSVRIAGVAKPGRVMKAANGVLRISWTDQAARTVVVYSDKMLRILAYPVAGTNVDLYLIRPKVWANIDRTLIVVYQ